MSLYDYRLSCQIIQEDPPFYALIMAAMHKADSENIAKLSTVFPDTWRELVDRYNAPGGVLNGD